MQFINHNLSADLSNNALADRFYLSRYHLMHKFKKETGYTLHNYIEQKRLANASAQIKKGIPVMKAAKDSGFLDYSTFLRAFRKKYGISPKEYARHTASFPISRQAASTAYLLRLFLLTVLPVPLRSYGSVLPSLDLFSPAYLLQRAPVVLPAPQFL